MKPLDANELDRIQAWRQGDCVVGAQWFVFRTDIEHPLTPDGELAAQGGFDNAESEVRGLMVLTQTCDVVRTPSDRPYIEVCPLVEVNDSLIKEIQRGRRPNYAFVPALAEKGLVADLERVMTVEKSVLVRWERVEGCSTDTDARRLALALARKRARTAFPDGFVAFARPLVERMSSKHDKGSDEGSALRALRELRVRAAPSWNAEEVELTFWFIRHDGEATFEGQRWDVLLEAWEKLIPATGRFKEVQALIQTLEDLTAREYVESDPLDLDHLSNRDA